MKICIGSLRGKTEMHKKWHLQGGPHGKESAGAHGSAGLAGRQAWPSPPWGRAPPHTCAPAPRNGQHGGSPETLTGHAPARYGTCAGPPESATGQTPKSTCVSQNLASCLRVWPEKTQMREPLLSSEAGNQGTFLKNGRDGASGADGEADLPWWGPRPGGCRSAHEQRTRPTGPRGGTGRRSTLAAQARARGQG